MREVDTGSRWKNASKQEITQPSIADRGTLPLEGFGRE
jgi:hypothetical protein